MSSRRLILAWLLSASCAQQPDADRQVPDVVSPVPHESTTATATTTASAAILSPTMASVTALPPRPVRAPEGKTTIRGLIDPSKAMEAVSGPRSLSALENTAPIKPRARTATTRTSAPVAAPQGTADAARRSPTRPAPAGTSSLSFGGARVGRSLSNDAIKDVVITSMGQVRACYERALKTDPDLGGRVLVSWRIDDQGRVSHAEIVDADTLQNQRMLSCVTSAISRWHFPAAEQPTTVTFPFTLQPG